MMISGERIREIAARELERHVQDPDFRSVITELVQQVEDAIRDDDLWILEVVKQLEEIQIIQQNQFYGERANLFDNKPCF
ncbi:unnamed protein product [Oikopleura dioica]|uniref:Uncharacterized protein n=1 Tax=Oikopleura dioica TaxID=34765 RepID=E4XVZ2_OIKDI|nr:unnamed protein product [Oikopleura dioica]